MIKHPVFRSSWQVTFWGLILAFGIGYYYGNTLSTALRGVFLVFVLAVLEVSISFDNAIVNASILKGMSDLWKKRFLTWGMLIAVFGMRLIFPLLIVSLAAQTNPLSALSIALFQPEEYARIMLSVEHEVAAFGGTFLLLVSLHYFFDVEKEIHWIQILEKPLVKMGHLEAVEIGFSILVLLVISQFIPSSEKLPFIYSGLAGILTYLGVEAIGTFLQMPKSGVQSLERASLASFIYLEVLDASFSFDGVVGAFAITNNLILIAIGLGIGAFFVRSITIFIVEHGTLDSFRFLEHGAFYAVWALAAIMFLNTFMHIPEYITGLVGALFIGFSIWASHKYKIRTKKHPPIN